MTTREKIVSEALTWRNTPYVDRAGIKGIGVDCAYLPLKILQAVGIIPSDFVPPRYSPQAWLKKTEDTTYLDTLLMFAKRELTVDQVRPGDLALYRLCASWTHGAIVVSWPDFLLHPIKNLGVIASRADEGVLRLRPRRFFSFVD